jgi:PPM family protein phosphatase
LTLVARPGALSDIGLHRKTNEDTFVVAPPLFAVCDGMGGALAGEVASGLAAETLAAGVAAGRPLLAAAEQANAAVFQRAHEDSDHSGMGTTLTAVVLEGDTGHFVHIGDSRAYLLRDGVLEQLSDDHSLVGEMLRDGRLSEKEAASHPHRSILSRALGTESVARIDEFAVDLRAGDVLLLCSDGLSGVVTHETIGRTLGRADPGEAAATLIADAREHGGPDNITAVVVRFDEPFAADEPLAADEEVTLVVPVEEAVTTVLAPAAAPDGPPPAFAATEEEAAQEPGEVKNAGDAHQAAFTSPDPHGAAEAPTPASGHKRRLGCLTALLALLTVVMGAGALTVSTVFYVGVDDGRLAVYSGLPAALGPIQLHAVYRRSSLSYESLGLAERRLVDEQSLHTRGGIMTFAETLGMWP